MAHRPAALLLVSLASVVGLGVLPVFACGDSAPRSGFEKDAQLGPDSGDETGKLSAFDGSGSELEKGTHACVPDKGAYDIPGDGCDNDNDGKVDNAAPCDATATGSSAADFARTIGLCDDAATRGFGLVSAKFTRGYLRADVPDEAQHGTLTKFGNVLKPREGARLGVLSTGFAQEYNGAPDAPFGGQQSTGKDWFGGRGNGSAPPGFPKPAVGCTVDMQVNDVATLRLELKAPKNASGIKFDFNFHSGEWPAFICSDFNDGFIAYLSAKGFNGGRPDNISFDAKKNPVSVNNAFLDRCTDGATAGCRSTPIGQSGPASCPGGPDELAGTGFGVVGTYCPRSNSVSGAATGWLSSQAPVTPGETFTLEFMIWDTSDGILDSSVLLDNVQWVAGEVITRTERPQPR